MADGYQVVANWEGRTGQALSAKLPRPVWLLVRYTLFLPFWFTAGLVIIPIINHWPLAIVGAVTLAVKFIWGDAAAGMLLLALLVIGAALGDDGEGGGGGDGGGGNRRAEKYIKWRAWHSMG